LNICVEFPEGDIKKEKLSMEESFCYPERDSNLSGKRQLDRPAVLLVYLGQGMNIC